MKTTYGIAALCVLLLATPALAAKEKANRTKCKARADKCVAKMENIGSSGMDGIDRTVSLLLPAVQKLMAAGEEEAARKVADRAVRQIRHRGHVTVLKLQQTEDRCVAKLRDKCGEEDGELIAEVEQRGKEIRERVRDHAFKADSFFDVFFDIDV